MQAILFDLHETLVTGYNPDRRRRGGVTVVSNTTHEEVSAWDSCKLADLIEDPVFSFRVGAMKPEPAIYAEALRRVGCTASEAVFVGDGGSSELAGARRLGMEPIWGTWFLERWPGWRMSQVEQEAASCRRCRDPADLIDIVRNLWWDHSGAMPGP